MIIKTLIFTAKIILVLLILLLVHLYREFAPISKDYISNKYPNLAYYDYENKVFVSPKPIITRRDQITGGDAGLLRFSKPSPNAPTQPLPKVALNKNSFADTPEPFAIYWLGHSSAIIELNSVRLIVDPVFNNAAFIPMIVPRYDQSPIEREQLPPIDIVLLTHDHYDHLERSTIQYLKDKGCVFVTPLGVGERLRKWGVADENIRELGWEERTQIKGIDITAMTAVHYSGRSFDQNRTLWTAYGIKSIDKNIFWSGDTGYSEHLKAIGDKYGPFDLAAIEMDGWNPGWPNTHLFPHQVVQAAQDVKAKLLMPTHWAVFDLALHPWRESIEMTVSEAERQNVVLVTPKLGEKLIPTVTQTTYWWREE